MILEEGHIIDNESILKSPSYSDLDYYIHKYFQNNITYLKRDDAFFYFKTGNITHKRKILAQTFFFKSIKDVLNFLEDGTKEVYFYSLNISNLKRSYELRAIKVESKAMLRNYTINSLLK